MTDPVPTPPAIQVDPSAIPGALMLALRQLALAAGGWAIGRGYLSSDTAAALGTVALVVVPVVWSQARTFFEKQKLVTVADAAPDSVAVVTNPAATLR